MKQIKLTIIFTIFILAIVPAILAMGIKNIPDVLQPPLSGTLKLFGSRKMLQMITARNNNFTGIGFSIRNPNYIDKNNLILSIYNPDKTLVRQAIINGGSIADGDLLKIDFSPIKDSMNKNYIIELASPDSLEDHYFEVFTSNNNSQVAGMNFQLNSANESSTYDGSIAYELYFRPSSPVSLVMGIYITAWQRLTADLGFTVIYLIIIAGLLIYVVKPASKKDL